MCVYTVKLSIHGKVYQIAVRTVEFYGCSRQWITFICSCLVFFLFFFQSHVHTYGMIE